MSNEMEQYGEGSVELHSESQFNREMESFANIVNGTTFDYFYIDSARWDKEGKELFIIVKIITPGSGNLTTEGHIKYIEFKKKHTNEYFTAQVMRNTDKLNELSNRFKVEHEQDIQQELGRFLLNKFNEVKTLEYSTGSKMSVDIEVEDVNLFVAGKL